jgi:CO/xanthine dehydrogenase Mo-binding subunit
MADQTLRPEPGAMPPAHIAPEERKEQKPAATAAAETFFGKGSNQVDSWLAIEPDGTLTVFSGKVELGTGVRTALAQIVAEELDVPVEQIRVVMGDTERTPDEGYTAGSMTIIMSGSALRQAAAEARRALLELASEQLDAGPEELAVRAGTIFVSRDPDRTITYAALMGGKPFQREVTGSAPLKRPEDYRVVGTSTPRVDLLGKLSGQTSFIHDWRVPGMLHGRLVPPPSASAQLLSIDESSVASLPGLVKVVRRGNWVGVVAEREEQASLAAQRLKLEWSVPDALPRMEDLYTHLRQQPPVKDEVLLEAGDTSSALGRAAHQLHSTYYQPYHAHASIGPSCAVADVRNDQITVWTSTQGPNPLRGALAQLLNVPPERVHLIHVEGAGSYGHNGADDAAADAVLLSQAVSRPVRVQWSREQEFVWEPKAAAMVMEVTGGLDAHGNIIAWEYDVWSPTHTTRPRFAGQLLAAQWMAAQAPPPIRFFLGGERNAPTNYAFPNQQVRLHWLASSPLRISSFRSLGGTGNTFANESFMDELAAAAGADALEFRLRHLTDPRGRAVLTAAAEHAGWQARPAPRREQAGLPPGAGRGLAFAQYENAGAYVATVAEVQVDRDSGVVRVQRIVVAHDCGLIINPDGVTNQVEGNVIQSLSRALKEEVTFDRSRVTSVDWLTYPILTFSEVPQVEVVLINRPDQPALGAGEPAMVTTAPAVANAIFDACGARLRQAPFIPARVKAALR